MVEADSDGVPHNFEVYAGSTLCPPEMPDTGNLVLSQQAPNNKKL